MRIIAVLLALLPAVAFAGKPGWRTEGGAKYYYSANSFPTYRPPVVRYQPLPLVPVKNPDRGGFTYVQTIPVLDARGTGGYVPANGGSVPALSVGNWGGGYIGNTYVPPGMVISNPFCR